MAKQENEEVKTGAQAGTATAEEALPFDALMQRLDGIVGELEGGELPLERALVVFEEGVRLARQGARRLDAAERQVEVLLAETEADGRPPSTPS